MKIKAAIAASLLAVTLSGCGSAHAGDAAVVDGASIKIDDLNKATQQISEWNGQAVDPQTVLYFLVTGPKVVAAASQAGVGVSTNDAYSALASKVSSPDPAAVSMLQSYGAAQRIRQLPETQAKGVLDQLATDLRASDVSVNPRYGSIDMTTLEPAAALENWIYTGKDGAATTQPSVPSDGASPTPSS